MNVMFVDGSEIGKFCPKCKDQGRGDVKLIVRTNKTREGQFIGCPNWPHCDYTENIPQEMYMRATGQPTLF
jgi:ssDNA-binding Zn-finger/Zn-ribbon topoisomerase 1